jgi:hypothetical protein
MTKTTIVLLAPPLRRSEIMGVQTEASRLQESRAGSVVRSAAADARTLGVRAAHPVRPVHGWLGEACFACETIGCRIDLTDHHGPDWASTRATRFAVGHQLHPSASAFSAIAASAPMRFLSSSVNIFLRRSAANSLPHSARARALAPPARSSRASPR